MQRFSIEDWELISNRVVATYRVDELKLDINVIQYETRPYYYDVLVEFDDNYNDGQFVYKLSHFLTEYWKLKAVQKWVSSSIIRNALTANSLARYLSESLKDEVSK